METGCIKMQNNWHTYTNTQCTQAEVFYHRNRPMQIKQCRDPQEQASSGHYNIMLAPMIYGLIGDCQAMQLLRPTDTT